jgi:hypothetical protein
MTATQLTVLAGALLSLAFSYVPSLKEHYAPLTATQKRLVMLALLALTASSIFALACLPWGSGLLADYGVIMACDQSGALGLLQIFLAALIANQATYLVTP